jgi:hypothetical protein
MSPMKKMSGKRVRFDEETWAAIEAVMRDSMRVGVVPQFEKGDHRLGRSFFIMRTIYEHRQVREPKGAIHSFCKREAARKENQMNKIGQSALALTLVGGLALFSTPSFAVEPDVDSAAGPELPAPRTSDPDFQQDDQSGAVIDPEVEGANPSRPYVAVPEEPDTILVPD